MKPIHKIITEFQAQIDELANLQIEKQESDMQGIAILRFLEAKALCTAAEKLCEDYKEAAIEEAQDMFPDGKGIIFGVPISLQSSPTLYDWAQDPIWMDLNAASTLRINALKDEIKAGKMPVPIKSLGSKFIKVALKK